MPFRPLWNSVALCAFASFAVAEDWPQWRGPNRDGVCREKGLLEQFPPTGLNIHWRTSAGAGFSTPAVADGRVYLTDVGSDPAVHRPTAVERMRCFDEKTGQLLWSHQYLARYFDWAFNPKNPNGPSCTPLVHEGKVYARGAAGELCCLDAAKGSVVWRMNTSDDFGVTDLSGTMPSPVVEGELLILMVGGKPGDAVVAVNKNTGKEVWHSLSDRWTYSSPIIITAGGQRQLIVFTPQAVTSLNPATGQTWWRHPMATPYADATPVWEGNLLLVSGTMFQLDPDKPEAGVLWQQHFSDTSIPLLMDGCVYAAKTNGHLICLEATTAKRLWEVESITDRGNGATIHLNPNGDSVLLFTNQGNLIRARLTRDGYTELSRVHLIDPTFDFAGREVLWTAPAYANGHIFIRSDKELICASLTPKS